MTFDPAKFKEAQKTAWTSVAEDWHNGLAPHLVPVSKKLIALVGIPNGSKVLELACGDGSLSLETANAGAAEVVATDHAPSFGPIVLRRAEQAGHKNQIRFQECDIEHLPFGEKEFDVVLCQFGLMFAPDLKRCLQEVYRVLKPQGSFAAAVWGTAEQNPGCAAMLGLLNEHLPPRAEGQPSLFDLGKPKAVEASLQSVGFRDYKEILMEVMFNHKNADEAWKTWRANGPFAAAFAQWDKSTKKEVEKDARKIQSKYKTLSKSIEIPATALLFSAKRGFETLQP